LGPSPKTSAVIKVWPSRPPASLPAFGRADSTAAGRTASELSSAIPSYECKCYVMFLSCRRTRVARWYIFKQKIPIWVNFGGPWNGKVGIFYCHLDYIGQFCIFSPVLV
jgi:hypothetical protein